jgi:cytochrome c oxidase cbb3-type subunit 3
MDQEEKDKLMDHEYDGIQEFDNNLPSWWLNGFYFTVVFGIIYLIMFEFTNSSPNMEAEYKSEMFAAYRQYNTAEYLANLSGTEVKKKADAVLELSQSAIVIEAGKALYHSPKALCFTCHGDVGQGLVGPNLTDKFWMHGGKLADVYKSIRTGYPDKGMMQYGSGQKLTDDELQQLVSYIASLQGTNPANPKPLDALRDKEELNTFANN